ncbi:MAG TPA: zf-HC2 domain-containing protein [Polyangiaceae bacterium]|nr:zf-HC2 domain-containing protein [Polyangiaceae bacterium]
MKPQTISSSNSCRRLAPAVTIFVDGELEPSQVVEVETHLSDCGRCRERVALDRAVRASLRALPRPSAPQGLRDRVAAAMAEGRREAEAAEAYEQAAPLPRAPYKYMAPLAMAAGVALMLTARNSTSPDHAPSARGAQGAARTAQVASTATSLDGMIEELLDVHEKPLPPEVTRQDEVGNFGPFVGVPVEAPKLTNYGAKFYGGRMLPVREQRAAMLQYGMAGGRRVTVYVYDPRRVQPEQRWLRERVVRDAPVYVGQVRGFNVAATERRGNNGVPVGVAIAADLDEREILELVTDGAGAL